MQETKEVDSKAPETQEKKEQIKREFEFGIITGLTWALLLSTSLFFSFKTVYNLIFDFVMNVFYGAIVIDARYYIDLGLIVGGVMLLFPAAKLLNKSSLERRRNVIRYLFLVVSIAYILLALMYGNAMLYDILAISSTMILILCLMSLNSIIHLYRRGSLKDNVNGMYVPDFYLLEVIAATVCFSIMFFLSGMTGDSAEEAASGVSIVSVTLYVMLSGKRYAKTMSAGTIVKNTDFTYKNVKELGNKRVVKLCMGIFASFLWGILFFNRVCYSSFEVEYNDAIFNKFFIIAFFCSFALLALQLKGYLKNIMLTVKIAICISIGAMLIGGFFPPLQVWFGLIGCGISFSFLFVYLVHLAYNHPPFGFARSRGLNPFHYFWFILSLMLAVGLSLYNYSMIFLIPGFQETDYETSISFNPDLVMLWPFIGVSILYLVVLLLQLVLGKKRGER